MQDSDNYLSQALKSLRKQRAWSLDYAAGKTGVSKAMLGQIERAESSPTIATLWKIANGFQTSISYFLEPPADYFLQGATDQGGKPAQKVFAADSLQVTTVFPYDARLGFELLELTLMPGGERLSEPHATGVIEHVIVIDGTMELLVEGRWIMLPERGAVRFAADRPHGYRNPGGQASVFHNLIYYPPGYDKPEFGNV
ncbi:MAG TPA: XRE family transcriptional regulator [Candidimonas sp.]|nr:XRE family transcriptional regulator [Candidimonas sp.]